MNAIRMQILPLAMVPLTIGTRIVVLHCKCTFANVAILRNLIYYLSNVQDVSQTTKIRIYLHKAIFR